jgi:hypothetical protein
VGLLRAKGLQRADKLSLMRFSTAMRWMGWQLYTDCSVSELLQRFDQTDAVRLMWRPLCLAALNTPPERASARVFLNVLRDSLARAAAAPPTCWSRGGPERPAARRGRPLRGAARRRGAQGAKVDSVRAPCRWPLASR